LPGVPSAPAALAEAPVPVPDEAPVPAPDEVLPAELLAALEAAEALALPAPLPAPALPEKEAVNAVNDDATPPPTAWTPARVVTPISAARIAYSIAEEPFWRLALKSRRKWERWR